MKGCDNLKAYDLTDSDIDVLNAYRTERDSGKYNQILKDYKDPATKYAFKVLEEQVITSETIKLDAFRHLQDLRRQSEDNDFHYYYDLDEARTVVRFAALCPNPDSAEPTPLMDWQLAILCKIVAWKDSQTHKQRFSDVIVSVARTNGKTYLAVILVAYYFLLSISGKHNQDLLYAAITSSQTDKGWRYIMSTFRMLETTPGFKSFCKKRGLHVVTDKVSDNAENRLLKMSQQSGVFDSYHFCFAVVDEAGSNEMPIQKINDNKGKITSGMTQTNGQIVQISTAYPDSNSYLYRDEKMMVEAMKRDNDRALDDHLLMLWQQDNIDEVHDPESWAKSNPLVYLNDEKRVSMIQNLIGKRDASLKTGTLADFENKNLNLWLQAKVDSYLSLKDIENATMEEPPIDINGRDVFIGLDLSHFSDDSAVAFVIPYHDSNDNVDRFYIIEHSFVPLARSQNSLAVKSAKDGINYQEAADLGYATIANNEYGYVNDDTIYDYVLNFVADHDLKVKFFLYDAWQADPIIQRFIEKTDWEAMPVRQGTISLNGPTTYFRKAMDSDKIRYLDDPILIYSLKNAILKTDNNGIKVDKDKATAKIDVVDAIIDCMFRAQYYFDGLDPDFKEDNKNPFKGWSEEDTNNYFSNYTF